MATTINADTTNGLVITPDTSGDIELQSNGTPVLDLNATGFASDINVNGLTVGRGGGDLATNTAVGTDALDNNTTGANNTGLGSSAGSTITTGSNNTLIGYDAEPSSATVSNEVTIGNASVDTLRMGNGDVIYPSESGGGTLRTQVYTASGTWTNPGSVTRVKVTVIGGGAGAGLGPNPAYPGAAGGTSSFGSYVSSTGGQAPTFAKAPGSGTVSTGTAIVSGPSNGPGLIPWRGYGGNTGVEFGGSHILSQTNPANTSYSTTSYWMAGASGQATGTYPTTPYNFGGVAIADVPIPTANVSVTVGVGGNHQTVAQNNGKGAGGVVVVEWVE